MKIKASNYNNISSVAYQIENLLIDIEVDGDMSPDKMDTLYDALDIIYTYIGDKYGVYDDVVATEDISHVRTCKTIDIIDDVNIYWDNDTGYCYIYTKPNGTGRMEFEDLKMAKEYIRNL